jgi:hypothetical protein
MIERTYLNPKEASEYTGTPVASLATMRTRGGGPRFLRPGGRSRIMYLKVDLDEWMQSNPRTSTSSGGFRASAKVVQLPPHPKRPMHSSAWRLQAGTQ